MHVCVSEWERDHIIIVVGYIIFEIQSAKKEIRMNSFDHIFPLIMLYLFGSVLSSQMLAYLTINTTARILYK